MKIAPVILRHLRRVSPVLLSLLGLAACSPRVTPDATPVAGAPAVVLPGEEVARDGMFRRIRGRDGAVDSFGVSLDTLTGRPLDSFLIDGLGQLYRWTAAGALTKIAAAGEVLSGVAPELRYRNTRLGRLAQLDLTNPLRPVLFYREAQTVVWLDRNLAELRQLALVELDVGQVDAVAYARNDALWLYSADQQTLQLLDRQRIVQQRSPVLSQLFGKPVRSREIVATAQQVTLATEDGRMLFFGPFGGYRTQVLQPGHYLIAEGEHILFFDQRQWWAVGGATGLPVAVRRAPDDRELLMLRDERLLWRAGNRVWVE